MTRRCCHLLCALFIGACLAGGVDAATEAGQPSDVRTTPDEQAGEAVEARVEALLREASSYLEEDKAKREAAQTALVEIGAPAVPHLVSRLSTADVMEQIALFNVVPRIGEPAVAPLHELLRASTPSGERAASRLERRRAITLIGTIGSPSSRAVFIGACDDPDWVVRSAAAAGLGKLVAQDAEAGRRLVALLGDGDWHVRLRAVLSLGDAGAGGWTEAVAGCLLDEHFAVRRAACEILGDLGGDAVAAIARRLEAGAASGVQRATCLEALRRTSSGSAVAAIEPHLADPDAVVRYYAVEAFAATASGADAARCRALLETEAHPAVRQTLERAAAALDSHPHE